jgi:hypothetical protein
MRAHITMKPNLLVAAIIVAMSFQAQAQPREWTEAGEGGRKLHGELVEKGMDGDKPQIQLSDGKRVQIPMDKLSSADQEYVRKWTRPADMISTAIDVTTKSDGFKTILVQFQAGTSDMTIVCSDETKMRKTSKIKAGETGEFTFECKGNYKVVAKVGEAEMDVETPLKKTGKAVKRK